MSSWLRIIRPWSLHDSNNDTCIFIVRKFFVLSNASRCFLWRTKCLPIHFHLLSWPHNCNHQSVLQELSCSFLSSPLLNYCNKTFFTSSGAGLPDDKHISFSVACSCMSKGFGQFKNPICSCWTFFSLFLRWRGLQNGFLKSTACYILTDSSHIGTQNVKSSQMNYHTLNSNFTESLLQT